MKILYGVNTNGQGHLNRARTIIDQFEKDGHEVHGVLSGPTPPEYAYSLFDRYISEDSYELVYKNKMVDIPATIWVGAKRILNMPKNMKSFLNLTKKENYDVVITDFDIFTSLAGKFLGVPTISIDHQHSFLHKKSILAPGNYMDHLSFIIAIYAAVPYRSHFIGLDYVDKMHSNKQGTLHPLIYKSDIRPYDISVKDHFVVYLNIYSPKDLLQVFRHFPSETFHVYGMNIDKKVGNVHFKPTSRYGFLEDFTSSKGIISHSGFSITWEAAITEKPIFVIPQKHQYEQYTNAYRLEELDMAYNRRELTIDDLEGFIKYAKSANYSISNSLPVVEPETFNKRLYHIIDQLS